MLEIKCYGVKFKRVILSIKKDRKLIASLLLEKDNFNKLLMDNLKKELNKWMVSAFHLFVGFG
jgi:hypothetical protein